MGSPSRHSKGGSVTGSGQHGEMQSWGVKAKGWGRAQIPLATAPAPPQECQG